MKKLLTILMAICIAVLGVVGFTTTPTAVNAEEQQVSTTASAEENNRPSLKVGMECAYQPYNWTQFNDADGAVAISERNGEYANGYDVMIAKKIAEELNMKLEVYAYTWENLINGLQTDALDLIIAGMSPTAERKKQIDFTLPYYTSNLVVVVRKDGPYANAKTLADLSAPNSNGEPARIVAQFETFHDKVVDQIPNVNHVEAMVDFPTMITALNAKTVDGYIAEKPGAIADCNGNSNFTFVDLKNNDTGFTIEDLSNVTLAVGVKKGNPLLAQVNSVIETISVEEQDQLMNQAITLAEKLNNKVEANYTWLYVLLGIVAVVAIGAAVYFFVVKKNKKKN